MKRGYLVAAALLAVGMVSSASAQAISFTVDCARGQSIGQALERGDARKLLLVIVRGTCSESVAINREDVTLRGDPQVGGTLIGTPGRDTVLISASRVNIEDLDIVGGNIGIRLQGPFYAGVRNSSVRDTNGNGILVRAGDIAISGTTVDGAGNSGLALHRGASARVVNSRFLNSQYAGVFANSNSTADVSGSEITGNGSHGAQFEGSSHGTLTSNQISGNAESGIVVSESQATIAENTIIANGAHGVLAQAAATVGMNGNTITGNGGDGVSGYLGPTLVLYPNDISWNMANGVFCMANCTMQIDGGTITGNGEVGVAVMMASRVIFAGPEITAGAGNQSWVDLWCGDKESSVDGAEGLTVSGGVFFAGRISDTCTGFDD
jgi:parallel beta-helix repeat protein